MILRILLNALAVFVLAYLLPGIAVDGFGSAVLVAIVLGLLNVFVKPLLVVLTLPVTILTLGLFLLVVNVIIVSLTDHFLEGFSVDGFWWALLFSILLSIASSILSPKKESNNI